MKKLEVTISEHTESGWRFLVDLTKGSDIFTYRVSMDRGYCEGLCPGEEPEEVVKKTFQFLLQREGPQAILSEFDISDVKSYFPDFESMIHEMPQL